MTTAEAILTVERFAPNPEWAPSDRNWPLAIITACGQVDRQLVGANLDLMTEAVSVLTGIPFTELLAPHLAAIAADTKHTIGTVTELAPNLTLTDRGRTTGPHIGIPLAHVEAILRMEDSTAPDLSDLADEDKDRVHETFKEMREFVAAEGTPR